MNSQLDLLQCLPFLPPTPSAYVIERPTSLGLGRHLAILHVESSTRAKIIEFTQEGLGVQAFLATPGWRLKGSVSDVAGLKGRLHRWQPKAYDLLAYNCEHFVHELVSGVPRSDQILTVGVLAAFGLFLGALD